MCKFSEHYIVRWNEQSLQCIENLLNGVDAPEIVFVLPLTTFERYPESFVTVMTTIVQNCIYYQSQQVLSLEYISFGMFFLLDKSWAILQLTIRADQNTMIFQPFVFLLISTL